MTAATLHDIADRLERLAPSHRDPFLFHEEKSELVAELRRLAELPSEILPTAANDNKPRTSARFSSGEATIRSLAAGRRV